MIAWSTPVWNQSWRAMDRVRHSYLCGTYVRREESGTGVSKRMGPLPSPGEGPSFERACKPDSVLPIARHGWPSICAAYPGTSDGPPVPCLALLRTGFAWPHRSPGTPVSSYLTLSPLPESPRAVYFLLHFPRVAPPGIFPSVLPCGVRTFLGPEIRTAATRPAPCYLVHYPA
jgi:hypothetical protein